MLLKNGQQLWVSKVTRHVSSSVMSSFTVNFKICYAIASLKSDHDCKRTHNWWSKHVLLQTQSGCPCFKNISFNVCFYQELLMHVKGLFNSTRWDTENVVVPGAEVILLEIRVGVVGCTTKNTWFHLGHPVPRRTIHRTGRVYKQTLAIRSD